MSKLLIEDSPLLILPKLAVAIGLNEAIFLQQLHYWINHKNAPRREGLSWHYESYSEWREQFPFWSLRTLKRTVHNLKKLNIVIAKKFNAKFRNHTCWYSINRAVFAKIEKEFIKKEEESLTDDNLDVDNYDSDEAKMAPSRSGQNGTIRSGQNGTMYKKEIISEKIILKDHLRKGTSVDKSKSSKDKSKKDDFKKYKVKEEKKEPIVETVVKQSKNCPYAKMVKKGKSLKSYLNEFSATELKCYEDIIAIGIFDKVAIGMVLYHQMYEIVGLFDEMKKYKIRAKGKYFYKSLFNLRNQKELFREAST